MQAISLAKVLYNLQTRFRPCLHGVGNPGLVGIGFFCFVSSRAWKQKKPTPLDRGPPLHVNKPVVNDFVRGWLAWNFIHWACEQEKSTFPGLTDETSLEPLARCLILKSLTTRNVWSLMNLLRSLINDDSEGNENGKNAISLDWQNNNFARASRFFCTLLNRLCTTTTWKCLISRFLEDGNFSWTLIQYFRIQLQLQINLPIRRDGISAIKFEAARIHFLSDVFVAVAVVVG